MPDESKTDGIPATEVKEEVTTAAADAPAQKREKYTKDFPELFTWGYAFFMMLMWTMLVPYIKLRFDYGSSGIPYLRKESVPYVFITMYTAIMCHHAFVLTWEVRNMLKKGKYVLFDFIRKANRPLQWRVIFNAHMKLWTFVSCSYFIYRIEEHDNEPSSRIQFKDYVIDCMALHLFFFFVFWIHKPTEKLPDVFKYVPTLPSAGILCYSIYRCLLSDELWELGREEIGLFANNALLLIMFFYEDFIKKDSRKENFVNLVGNNPDLDSFQQSRFGVEDPVTPEEVVLNDKIDKILRLLTILVYPGLFLSINYIFAHGVSLEVCGYYRMVWLPSLFLLCRVLREVREHFEVTLISYVQIICCFSLHTEMPHVLLSRSMDNLSAPLFYVTVLMFLSEILVDWIDGNIISLEVLSRSLFYWYNYSKPEQDWRFIVRNLTYIKNIEEFNVDVSEEGSVTIHPKNKLEEVDLSDLLESDEKVPGDEKVLEDEKIPEDEKVPENEKVPEDVTKNGEKIKSKEFVNTIDRNTFFATDSAVNDLVNIIERWMKS